MMIQRVLSMRTQFLILAGLYAVRSLAAPSVNVALKASFSAPPYLLELLETAAEENSTAYFPLLDKIAQGHFDQSLTDQELHTTFLKTLKDDGHITDAESLSLFEFALSIHSAAPRIEAHHQFYETSVDAQDDCENWVYFDNKQYCSPNLAGATGKSVGEGGLFNLPFDRILGDAGSKTPSIVYADITSPSFRNFHKTISQTAKSGKTSYRVRYKPIVSQVQKPLSVSGYGIELALKRTDYIVIDDRAADEGAAASLKQSALAIGQAALSDDEEVADLKPLSASELLRLDMKAASFVLNSQKPMDTLVKLTQDFPKHSSAISAINVSQTFLAEHVANRESFLPPGFNILWINGVQIVARDFDAFSMLEHLRRERKLINSAKELGLSGEQAIKLLSHPAFAEVSTDMEAQRYDWRDEDEGGNVIMWLNNIEQDKRYADWPEGIQNLLARTYPGQLPAVKKDIHNFVLPIDFSAHNDVLMVVESIQSFIRRGVPVQFGLVPIIDKPAGVDQAKVVYHLIETYGLSVALQYLQKSLDNQGRKLAFPAQSQFDQATKDVKLKKDRTAFTLQDVLSADSAVARLNKAQTYLARLGADGPAPPYFVNGVAVQRGDDWMQLMSNRVGLDSRMVQQAVYLGQIQEQDSIVEWFLTGASPRRNALIIPEDEKDIKFCNLASIVQVQDGRIGDISSLPADQATIESELVQLVVVANFDTRQGHQLLSNAILFHKDHDNVELFLVHSGYHASTSNEYSDKLWELLSTTDRPVKASDVEAINYTESSESGHAANTQDKKASWGSADTLLSAAGIAKGRSGIVINGRIVGPFDTSTTFDVADFEMLLSFERKKRLVPAAIAFKELELIDKTSTPHSFAKLSSLIALSTVSDVPEGIFDAPPTARTSSFEEWKDEHSVVSVGDKSSATIQVVASLDPASEVAQRWVPILKVLSELEGVNTRLFLNPKERLEELPLKCFYRHVLQSKPAFEDDGSLKGLRAEFGGLPTNALLTMALDTPPAWLVSPRDSVHDLDNIKLSSLKGGSIEADYELEYILIEGHSRDATLGSPPRGAQLVLGTQKEPHFADTIVMSNLGYFQFKAKPGFYNLTLQKGRTEEIFNLDSAGALGYNTQPGDEFTEIALTSFRGTTLFPRLSRKPGMEEEDVLEAAKTTMENLADQAGTVLSSIGLDGKQAGDWLSKASKYGSSLLSGSTGTELQPLPHADINIFSVASGHLYERMLNIMMVSVMKHTSHTVKFWFIEQFLSPSFKAFLPTLAEEYGFRYEMVMYKWPHWLRAQKEKQREIWGYKILFLDVLFPLDLDKVIFVDADQIVRTDMIELVQHNLQGAPYGFTPMCDSRTEMEGFRFWKQGYWKNFLRGSPYHISALYVVDLVRFRQMAAGDRLRQQYHQLSADPNSLSNLDQDLPNHMQHVLPIHSLPQEWLWCETWCSDESLGVARTIDLCNNPQTKEPKLDRARRQVPEWTIYDEEIAALAKQKAAPGDQAPIAGNAGSAGAQEEMQREEAAKHREEMAAKGEPVETPQVRIKDEL